MMHIEVDDRYLSHLSSIGAHCVRSRHRNIIDEAEAVGARLTFVLRVKCLSKNASVVAGRTCSAECIPIRTGHYRIYSLDS